MTEQNQIDKLADYIIADIPGEPSCSEGAGDTAIRLLQKYRGAFRDIMNELGEPQPATPAPVANAHEIAEAQLET